MFLRISPSPPDCEESEPFASTMPIRPFGARCQIMCCNHAKFALPEEAYHTASGHHQRVYPHPSPKVEGGIRHNIIRFELRVTVIEERVGIELAEVSLNTANGKVHLRHFPCSRVGVLTKDGNLVDIATVVFDEFCRLDEHAPEPQHGS